MPSKKGNEPQVIAEVLKLVESLPKERRSVVLQTVNTYFGDNPRVSDGSIASGAPREAGISHSLPTDNVHSLAAKPHSTFDGLYDACNPDNQADRAAVTSFWLQVCENRENFTGQEVNDLLKDMGHGLSNVTHTLTVLISRKPALVRQVEKVGKSKQGRKKYKLTQRGIDHVRALLSGHSDNDEE